MKHRSRIGVGHTQARMTPPAWVPELDMWVKLLIGVAALLVALPKTWKVVAVPMGQWFVGIARLPGQVQEINKDVTTLKAAVGLKNGKSISDHVSILAARSQVILNLHNEPLWEASADGQNVLVNAAFEQAFGWPQTEISGHRWKQVIHEDDVDTYMQAWKDAVTDGRPFQLGYGIEPLRFRSRSQKVFRVQVRAMPINLGSGTTHWHGSVKIMEEPTGPVTLG